MNERIRQLAEQAKKYALDAMIKITDREQALKVYSESYDTKFAELIVKECVAICQDVDGEDNIDAKSGRQDCAVEIREHFGVEE
jgi:hypothetical protein